MAETNARAVARSQPVSTSELVQLSLTLSPNAPIGRSLQGFCSTAFAIVDQVIEHDLPQPTHLHAWVEAEPPGNNSKPSVSGSQIAGTIDQPAI